MLTKEIDGCKVEIALEEDEDRYLVRVDGRFAGYSGTTRSALWVAKEHIRKKKEEDISVMKVVLDEGAYMPVRAHDTDAGLDLMSRTTVRVWPGGSGVFDTGVHVEIPKGCCGLIQSKSGLNFNHDIFAVGLVDEGYTGSIMVKLYNLGSESHLFNPGDKIAQLVVVRDIRPALERAVTLEKTERGAAGFGSTGASVEEAAG